MSDDIKELFNDIRDGGNTFATKELLKTIDNNIRAGLGTSLKKISKAIYNNSLKSSLNCYDTFWLLNFQADYFANLVNYKFKKWDVNRAANLAVKMGVMYGAGAIMKIDNKYIPLYVSQIETDAYGYPEYISYQRADYLLINNSMNRALYPKNKGIIRKKINDDIILFLPYDVELGGLIKWAPFLKQFETLLKMLYTHSFSHIKSVLYNVSDPAAITDEIELYFNAENPLLINTSDDSILQNKFKEFKINSGGGSELVDYINEFLKIYYDLLGRRYNTDKKKERNISSEVDASQENYDILQRPYKQNIIYFIDEIKERWGENYTLENEKNELDDDEYNNPTQPLKVVQNAPNQQNKGGR